MLKQYEEIYFVPNKARYKMSKEPEENKNIPRKISYFPKFDIFIFCQIVLVIILLF